MQYLLRTATRADRPDLQLLIARSARQLGAADYRSEQIEGALQGAQWGRGERRPHSTDAAQRRAEHQP